MAILKDKKAIIIGDRDGIPGMAIDECVKTCLLYTSFESALCGRGPGRKERGDETKRH